MPYFHAVASAAASENQPARDLIGVLIVNLGTPDSPSYRCVQRYLREFLSDRRVIDTSRLIWLPLLYGVVLPFRPLRTARNYRKIWMKEGSPLAVYSQRLCSKVDGLLRAGFNDRLRVELAMTYGNPSIETAVESLAGQGVGGLIVLPLYPQYCSSTTGSVFDATHRALQRWRWLPEIRFINDYHLDEGYIDALAAKIGQHYGAGADSSHLLFSYHGIPASYVAAGDPYRRQAEATSRLVAARLGMSPQDWTHCYQSRFGRVPWLQPYTIETIKALADRGVRNLWVVSPSFAVDCLETLEEVALEYRDKFLEWGGERLTLIPCLNDDDQHAQALANIVRSRLHDWNSAG